MSTIRSLFKRDLWTVKAISVFFVFVIALAACTTPAAPTDAPEGAAPEAKPLKQIGMIHYLQAQEFRNSVGVDCHCPYRAQTQFY